MNFFLNLCDINEVEGMTKVISEYGVLVVIAAIFLGFCIWDRKTMNEMVKKTIENWFNTAPSSHPDAAKTRELDIIGDEIYDTLERTRETLHSDRAFVYLYHNGGVSNASLPFQKMSCISESVSVGVLELSDKGQNLQKGPYSKFCRSLRDTGEYIVKDVEEIKEFDSFLYQRIIMRHSQSIVAKAIVDKDGYELGFVAVDFSVPITDEVQLQIIRGTLMKTAQTLSGLVSIERKVDDLNG